MSSRRVITTNLPARLSALSEGFFITEGFCGRGGCVGVRAPGSVYWSMFRIC